MVNWLIHAMFLWGVDYLHFHSDKPECAGVWDATCLKPSRDYKAENRADLGSSFAAPRWVPISRGETQQVMLQEPPRCTQCPSPLPKTFSKDLWVCPEHEALVPHVWALRYKSGHCSWTNTTAPIVWLGLFLAIPESITAQQHWSCWCFRDQCL